MRPRASSDRSSFRLAALVAAGAAAAAVGVTCAWRHVDISDSTAVQVRAFPASSFPSMPERAHLAAVSLLPEAFSSEPARFEAGLVRAGRLGDADAREAARANLFAAWAEADPRAAFLHLRAHGAGEADRHREDIVFRQWAGRDFSAAFDYADRLPVGKSREEMLGWVALVVAESDPAEAAMMTGRDMQPGPERTETSIAILHRWARADLAAAAAWADALPSGPFRDRALDEVAGFMRDVPPARSPD